MAFIPATELILNTDGSVYHLNLLPGEIAETIILVGDPQRVDIVASFFDEIEVKKNKREFRSCTGTYKGKRLSVVATGIGPDNVDIVLTELDALVNIDMQNRIEKEEKQCLHFIRIGTCGGLHEGIEPGQAVFSRYAVGLDNLLSFYVEDENLDDHMLREEMQNHLNSIHFDLPIYARECGAHLCKILESHFKSGITLTCPGFYGPQGRTVRAEVRFPGMLDRLQDFSFGDYNLLNLEMESSALFGLGKLLGHQCAAVNMVVANRASQKTLEDYDGGIRKVIQKVLDLLAKA